MSRRGFLHIAPRGVAWWSSPVTPMVHAPRCPVSRALEDVPERDQERPAPGRSRRGVGSLKVDPEVGKVVDRERAGRGVGRPDTGHRSSLVRTYVILDQILA